MSRSRSATVTALLGGVLVGLIVGAPAATAGSRRSTAAPTPLEGSVAPFIEHFDGHRGEVRFLALLSPT